MNDSGRAVGEAMRFFKKEAGDVTVFHDELDLAPFKVKVKIGGGTAGHNGLRSIDAHLGNEFRRVRIGIGHPGHKDRVTGTSSAITPRPRSTRSATCSPRSPPKPNGWRKGDDARFMSDVALQAAAGGLTGLPIRGCRTQFVGMVAPSAGRG